MGRRAMEDANSLDPDPERISRDLGHDGLDALADQGCANVDRHRSVRAHLDASVLARTGRTGFDEAADADAPIAAVILQPLALRSLLPVEMVEATPERLDIVAAVELFGPVRRVYRGQPKRHLGRQHQVAPAKLDPIDA